METEKKILIITSEQSLREVLTFCFDGWGYEVCVHDAPLSDIRVIKRLQPDVVVADLCSASKSSLELCRLLKEDFFTAAIPIIALINKRQLRTQLLNLKQGVDDYLIKPPDPLDLRIRVEMAIKRSQYSFYANSLTGLPGGRIIEEMIRERLKKEAPFSLGYIDIDNFKYFNDVYGYLKGDMAILQTAYMLYTVIKSCGFVDDFIGHIGGDDFIFISDPAHYKNICQSFISMFDRITSFHYSPQDRAQGYIVARDRTHKVKKIPLMSVTVAVVNVYGTQDFKSALEVNERITEIKRYLKTVPGSKFMADRRVLGAQETGEPVINKKESDPADFRKPLGQILLDKRMVSAEQLDEALKIHWKRGIIIGEALKELKLITQEDLTSALKFQQSQESLASSN